MFLASQESFARNHLAMTARGVMEVVPYRPFYVVATKFSANHITLPKGVLVNRAQECETSSWKFNWSNKCCWAKCLVQLP